MKAKEKLVSVIMPVLNAESYLKEAVDSILNQTYQNLELLVIDDKSTDSTMDILAEYVKLDNRVKIFRNFGSGISAALNLGIDMAGGEYIARMDADDISLANRIAVQVGYMENHVDIGICSTQIRLLQEDGSLHDMQKYPEEDDRIRLDLMNYCAIAHPTVMFRSRVIKDRWRYNIMPEEDYDLWTRMAITEKFACLSDVLLYYRVRSDSTSQIIGRMTRLFVSNQIIKTYVKELFDIDVFQYRGNEFYVMDDSTVFEEPVQNFLFRQFQLLSAMNIKNKECGIFEKKVMTEFLCQRWQLVWEELGLDKSIIAEEVFGEFDKLLAENDEAVQQIFDNLFEKLRIWFNQAKKFVIFGLGNLGRKLLEDWENAKKDNRLKWELSALIDNNIASVDIAGKSFSIIKPETLTALEYDYVLISSKVYYAEIKSELLEMGIEEKRILYGGNIFNIIL